MQSQWDPLTDVCIGQAGETQFLWTFLNRLLHPHATNARGQCGGTGSIKGKTCDCILINDGGVVVTAGSGLNSFRICYNNGTENVSSSRSVANNWCVYCSYRALCWQLRGDLLYLYKWTQRAWVALEWVGHILSIWAHIAVIITIWEHVIVPILPHGNMLMRLLCM